MLFMKIFKYRRVESNNRVNLDIHEHDIGLGEEA